MIECKLLNRKGIGIDVNVDALKMAKSRLNFQYNNEYEPYFCTNRFHIERNNYKRTT